MMRDGSALAIRVAVHFLEFAVFLQSLWKTLFVAYQRSAYHLVKAELVHLFACVLLAPSFDGHAIGRNHHSGAVIAIATMHEHLLVRMLSQVGQKFGDGI